MITFRSALIKNEKDWSFLLFLLHREIWTNKTNESIKFPVRHRPAQARKPTPSSTKPPLPSNIAKNQSNVWNSSDLKPCPPIKHALTPCRGPRHNSPRWKKPPSIVRGLILAHTARRSGRCTRMIRSCWSSECWGGTWCLTKGGRSGQGSSQCTPCTFATKRYSTSRS